MDGYETRIHVFVVDDRFPRVTFTRADKSKDTKILGWDFPVFLSFRNGNELIKFYVASFSSLPSCLSFCTNFVWNDQFGK